MPSLRHSQTGHLRRLVCCAMRPSLVSDDVHVALTNPCGGEKRNHRFECSMDGNPGYIASGSLFWGVPKEWGNGFVAFAFVPRNEGILPPFWRITWAPRPSPIQTMPNMFGTVGRSVSARRVGS